HVLLAGEEWLLPQNRLAAPDTRHALHIDRQLADQQFGAEAGGAQLGMGEIEIVLPLGDMVGELVAERKADAARRAVAVDEIDADDLRLLAAVEREGRALQIAAGGCQRRTVALVEPFRLHARLALGRLA